MGVYARFMSVVTVALRNGLHMGRTDAINKYIKDTRSHFPHVRERNGKYEKRKNKMDWN